MDTPFQRILVRMAQLDAEFSTWEPGLRSIAEHMLPHRARWTTSDANRGVELTGAIINNAPLLALRVCSSGMMAGITSPARRWFKMTTPDPELAEHGTVRLYLHQVEERLRWMFSRCNFYQALADGTYPDLAGFGFHAMLLEEDVRHIMRAVVLPVGEYRLATSAQGQVDTIYRVLPMKVRQVVQEFGLEACSRHVREAYNKANYDLQVEVIHAIQPNGELVPGRLGPQGKAWSSDYIERTADTEGKFLRRGGFEEFPGLCPRWAVRGNDAYGRGPGSEVVGDCKALQHGEKKLAMLVDKSATPPMKGSEQLRGQRTSLLPGDLTYLPQGVQGVFEPAMQVQPGAIHHMAEHIARHERRINSGLFADLWRSILDEERAQPRTAREIDELKQEKMLQLGPALERLNSELLRPSIDRAFAIGLRRGLFPVPPKDLEGMELRVDFQSIMHQAQVAVGMGSVRVFVAEVANLATIKPEVLDKLNADEIVDEIAAMTGVKPDLVLTDEDVEALRAQRAQQQQAEKQGAAMAEAAKAGAALASAPAPAADNALGAVLQQFGPLAAGGLARA